MKYVFGIVLFVALISFFNNQESELKDSCQKSGGIMVHSDFGCMKGYHAKN